MIQFIHRRILFVAFITISIFVKSQNIEWIVKPVYDVISPYYDGIAVVKRADKWGYINEGGKEIIDPVDGHVYNFSENFGVVTTLDNTVTGIVDAKGSVIKPLKKLKIDPRFPVFSEGLLLVTDGKAWGYMNKNGEITIPCQYKYAKPFSEGLAGVALAEGWFYVDVSNQPVIRCETNKAKYWTSGFNKGKAFVLYENGLGCIDKSGNKIDDNLPSLKAPTDYSAYFANNLLCSGGEIIFDTRNRVVCINEKSGKVNQYLELIHSALRSNGSFTINGAEVPYNSKDVYWNNQSSATIAIYGKKGVVTLRDKPIIAIEKPDIITSTLGNPAEFKLQALNISQKDLDELVFRLERINEIQADKIKIGEKKEFAFSIPKNTDLAIENKEIMLSVSEYGLLLEKINLSIQVKDNPALNIEFIGKDLYSINLGNRIEIPVIIRNTSMSVAKDVNVIINDKSFPYDNHDLLPNDLIRIDIPVSESSSINVSVLCAKTPVIKKNKHITINVIPKTEIKDPNDNSGKPFIKHDNPNKTGKQF